MNTDDSINEIYYNLYKNKKEFNNYDLFKINNKDDLSVLLLEACSFDNIDDIKNISEFPCIVCKEFIDDNQYKFIRIDTLIEEYRNNANTLERIKNILLDN